MGERAKTYNSRFEYVLANNGPGYFYTIVFLQLFSAEVFQDVAERTVSISLSNEMNAVGSTGIAVFLLNLVWDGKQTAEIGNRVFLPDDSDLCHHRQVDRQPIGTEREKRTVDHLTQQCHRICLTQTHAESGQAIIEEKGENT
jgi:hypothetical protein